MLTVNQIREIVGLNKPCITTNDNDDLEEQFIFLENDLVIYTNNRSKAYVEYKISHFIYKRILIDYFDDESKKDFEMDLTWKTLEACFKEAGSVFPFDIEFKGIGAVIYSTTILSKNGLYWSHTGLVNSTGYRSKPGCFEGKTNNFRLISNKGEKKMSENKKEFRRSFLQVQIDEERVKNGLPPIDWFSIKQDEVDKHIKEFNSEQSKRLGTNVEAVGDEKEMAIKMLENDKNRLPLDQLIELQKQITDVMTKELEKKTKEILASTIPQKVVVSLKVNDKEIKEKIDSPHPLLSDILNLLTAGMNPLLVGPAGSGKTMLGDQCAKILDLPFGHLCFSAGVSEVWLFGRQTPNGFAEGEFSRMYKNGGVFLADEMDAADANLLLSINTALANNVLYNPISGEKIPRHEKFYFIGAANTFGKGQSSAYAGRNRLDAATLDRFVTVKVDYLEEIENKICPVKELLDALRELRNIIKKANSPEVISYRAFDKAYRMYNLGYNVKQIKQTLTLSWNDELKKMVQ